MQLRLHDALLPQPPAPAAAVGPSAPGSGWLRQLALAQGARSAPTAPEPPLLPARPPVADREAGLEPCGLPLAAGVPAPIQRPAPAAADAMPPEAPLPPPRGGEATPAERAPVRVHVEGHGGDGTRVWLGIDGELALASGRAAAAVAGLRQALQLRNEQLALVVCNGLTVYTAAAAAPQRPPRAAPSVPLPTAKESP